MPWSQVSPGHFQRKIGENEALIKYLGDRSLPTGHEHWSVTATASFRPREPLSAPELSSKLRSAWMALRFAHPSIAAVAEEGHLHYHVPSIDDLQKWSAETFFILDSDSGATVNDVVATIKPSPYVTAYYLASSSQIIMHTSHWRTDGYGIMQLLGAFFEALAGTQDPMALSWGLETERLAPSVEEVLRLPTQASPSIQEASKKYLGTASLAVGAVGVACDKDTGNPPGGTRGELLHLDVDTSRLVTEACARLHISPLAAVHATLAAVNRAGAPPDGKTRHYTSTMRFSLRPYLPAPYGTAAWASALYTGGYLLRDTASQSWLDNARHYHAHYEEGLSPEFLAARRQYAIDALAFFQAMTPPPAAASGGSAAPPPRSDIDISSVGDAELLIQPSYQNRGGGGGAFDVTDVSLGVECVTPQLYLFYWTFRGRMSFQLVYNEAYHSAEQVRRFLGMLEMILRELASNPKCSK